MRCWWIICICAMSSLQVQSVAAKKNSKSLKRTSSKRDRKSTSSKLQLARPKNRAEAKAIRTLTRKINRALRSRRLRRAKMGVIVMTPSGRILYARKAQTKFIPASNLKMFTLATALHTLGYHYRFKTLVSSEQPIDENGVLHGNLYIKGSGDPGFRSEELWRIVRDLHMKGLRKIQGRVIFDASTFDRKRFGAGWTDHSNQPREKYRPYLAPIGALALNFSTVAISVRPGHVLGQPARVQIDPNSYYFRRIINKTKTIGQGGRFKVRFKILPYRGYRDQVEVTGTVPMQRKAKLFWRRINFPGWYTAFQFAQFLRRQGIRVSRWPKRGKAPTRGTVLYSHFSRPLGQILQYVGKQSSNFTAEQVLKKIGAKRYGTPGTWEKGLKVVQDVLGKMGIPAKQYVMINGSGLGRANRLSPLQLAQVLQKMMHNARVQPEFVAAQATSGLDGTLRWRMRDRYTRGRVRAKTGSLDGVSTISGYILTRKNKRLIFAICMNGRLRQGRFFRRAQNNIARSIAQYTE